MREISELTLIGNYLIYLSERYGQDSIKYETAKQLNEKVLAIVNKGSVSYQLLQVDDKMSIVKKMISSGVFKTDPGNKITPFKQVYNYEITKNIYTTYSCDGNLVFKLPKTDENNKSFVLNNMKESYLNNLNLDLRNAVLAIMSEHKQRTK